MTDTEYATTDELNEFMFMKSEIPSPTSVGELRLLEIVSDGDSSTTRFYLDNAYVVASSYSFYYGVNELSSLSTPLTETTHYTLDKDLGILTLTSAGVTLVALNNIYVAYAFNRLGLKDSYLQDVLNRSASFIEKKTRTKWAVGTDATPLYEVVSDEKYDGKGNYNRSYFLYNNPLPDVGTNVDGAVTSGDISFSVDSTSGFPSSGTIGISNLKVAYGSKTATTFTAVTGITKDLDDGEEVLPFVFEASNTIEGTSPTYTVLAKGSDYDLEFNTGRVHFAQSEFNNTDAQAWELNPPRHVPNRFRASYIWGNDSIPEDIKQLTLMIACKEVLHLAVRKAHSQGLNDFNPGLINVDEAWIDTTIKSYKRARMAST